MEKLLKENWFKVSISIAVLIAALSTAYYFVILLPKNKEVETLSGNQSSCSQMENKAFSDYKKQEIQLAGKISSQESSSNHYNKRLKKCIVKISDMGLVGGEQKFYVFILDAIENKDLLSCTTTFPPSEGTASCQDSSYNKISIDQFDTLEKQYMTE